MCYNKTDVSPGVPCVTCNTQRIVTDGLIDRGGHVTLYSRIMFLCGKTKISEKHKVFSLETQPRKFILCTAFLRNRKMRLSRAE